MSVCTSWDDSVTQTATHSHRLEHASHPHADGPESPKGACPSCFLLLWPPLLGLRDGLSTCRAAGNPVLPAGEPRSWEGCAHTGTSPQCSPRGTQRNKELPTVRQGCRPAYLRLENQSRHSGKHGHSSQEHCSNTRGGTPHMPTSR